MILQQALGLGVIGFVVGKIAARPCGARCSRDMFCCPGRRDQGILSGRADLCTSREHVCHPRRACGLILSTRLEDEMREPAIHIENLKKRYGEGDTAVDALKGVDMTIWPGARWLASSGPAAPANHLAQMFKAQ